MVFMKDEELEEWLKERYPELTPERREEIVKLNRKKVDFAIEVYGDKFFELADRYSGSSINKVLLILLERELKGIKGYGRNR